jgi:hypothetical protein
MAFCVHCGSELGGEANYCGECGKPASQSAGFGTAVQMSAVQQEKVFLKNEYVTVTNTRFMVPGQTYAMAGVTSVRSEAISPSLKWPVLLSVVGFLFLFSSGLRLFGVFMTIVGVLIGLLLKTDYAVAITISSGEVRAVTDKDAAYIGSIVAAVNDSIVYRR